MMRYQILGESIFECMEITEEGTICGKICNTVIRLLEHYLDTHIASQAKQMKLENPTSYYDDDSGCEMY